MSFSLKQQRAFRATVYRAWSGYCRCAKVDRNDKSAQQNWYRAELFEAVGQVTTKECDGKRDFERAIAHFEQLAGDDIRWAMRLNGADARRVLHVARQIADELYNAGYPEAAVKAANYQTSESYLLAIAQRCCSYRRGAPVERLEDLEYYELQNIVISLKVHLTRLKNEPLPKTKNAEVIRDRNGTVSLIDYAKHKD